MGYLSACFEVGGRTVKLPSPCLKLARAMLKTYNLVRKHKHTYLVLDNVPYSINNQSQSI